MSTIRIGLIGAGANTRNRHIPGFQALDDVEIVCVANRSRESAQRVAEEFNIPNVHDHYMDVVADDEVDAVCIGTWPYLHAECTLQSLYAGKHVLCEARMAMNVAQARAMLTAEQESGNVAMIVPSPFGLAGDRFVRKLVAEGRLGEVREIYVRALGPSQADAAAPLHWRHREDLSGVNTLILGILNETVQRWFGRTESVSAQTSLFVPRRTDPETGWLQDVDVPDSILVLARMATGAACVYHVSGHAHQGGPPRIEAYGSEGTLIYNLADDTILAAGAGDSQLAPLEIPDDLRGGWRVEAEFIEAVRGERPVTYTTFQDGFKYMQFTEAARQSAALGERVNLSALS